MNINIIGEQDGDKLLRMSPGIEMHSMAEC